MHVSDWKWRAPLSGALQVAQQAFSDSSTNLVRIERSRQVSWSATCSCRASNVFLTEFTAVDPHTMQENGEFTGDGDNSASTALGAHQSHAPRFNL